MTQVTAEMVRHIAKLSALKLSDAEIPLYQARMEAILEYVACLKDVTTPTELSDIDTDSSGQLREDRALSEASVDTVMSNAPERHPLGFGIPKVL